MQNKSGFTIIELLVTMAIFGVLAAIAFPRMAGFSDNNRLVNQVNDLSSHFQYARSEAIKRVRSITVENVGSNANWHLGWDIHLTSDTTDKLRVVSALSGNTTFVGQDATTSIIFSPDGRSNVAAGSVYDIKLCQTGRIGNYGKQLSVFPIGRVTVAIGIACP